MIRAHHIKTLRDDHNANGMSIMVPGLEATLEMLDMEGLSIVNLSREPLELDAQLTKKPIAKWVYANRQSRSFSRPEAVLWSVRDGDTSVVGVGALVPDRVAQKARSFGLEVLEV